MPHIAITMLPGRTREIKQELARKMRDILAEELKVDPDIVSVSIEDVPLENWNRSMERIEPGNIIIYSK